jgi:FtsZ-binding cell division protein ZapB
VVASLLLALGQPAPGAELNPTLSDGNYNTRGGTNALPKTTGPGNYDNTAFGYGALYYNTAGYHNTASGAWALYNNTAGYGNTASGSFALYANTAGKYNTASGFYALHNNTEGNYNTASGGNALYSNTKGRFNTAMGYAALKKLVSGNKNIAVGINAGFNLTSGTSNIYLGNSGIAKESTTMRLGSVQTRTFIAGIWGTTVANGVPVLIDSNGQLGTPGMSSQRFKEDIRDMADSSRGIFDLRPVTFHYKKPAEDGSKPLEYGLIAEEVAPVYPNLVVYGADGQIETVQYHKLTPMLLNELQRLNRQLNTQTQQLNAQAQQLAELKAENESLRAELKAQSDSLRAVVGRLQGLEAQQRTAMILVSHSGPYAREMGYSHNAKGGKNER